MNADAPRRYDCAHWMHTLVLVFTAMFGLINLHAADAPAANLLLAEPANGSFTTASQIVASGRVEMAAPAEVVLTVNGTAVTLAPDGTFSHPVALAAERIFNPVLVELLTVADNTVARQRPVVIQGASLPATALAPESLAVRLTDGGLDQLELLVMRSVDLDVAGFLPPGSLFTQEVCIEVPVLPDICTDVQVTILDNPAPHFGALEVDLDAEQDQVNVTLTLQDLLIRAEVEAKGSSCTVTVTADFMRVDGAIHLKPDAANPAVIDVEPLGVLATSFGNFDDDTDCGGVLGDVVEETVKLLVGNIRERLQNGLENFLNGVDAAGNTPLTGVLEDVLGTFSVEAAINAAIAKNGLQARLPFNRISEDSDGITFVMDTAVDILPAGPCTTSQDNPALAALYDVPRLLPVLASVTPGGLQFDTGGMISATVLNQALRGATACALLQVEFTEVDINGTPTPITAGLLAAVLPAFSQLDPTQPIRVMLRPTLSPVVSGTPGPAGELIDLRVSAYIVEFFIPGETSPVMQAALDLRVGLNLPLNTETGALQLSIGEITDVSATLLLNPLGIDPARLSFLVEQIVMLLPSLSALHDVLTPITIPAVSGLDFKIVEVNRMDTYLGVFVDIVPQPTTMR